MSRLSFLFSFFVSILASFLFASSALAAGIGIAPQAFSIDQLAGSSTSSGISLHNTGESAASYELYADDYDQLIQLQGEELRLAPGEARYIPVEFASFPPGTYETAISVVATDVSSDDLPKTGVKIPVTLNSTEPIQNQPLNQRQLMILLLVAIGLGSLILAFMRQRQKSKLGRVVDNIQGMAASGDMKRSMTYYKKKHPLILLSAIAICFALGLLIWSFASTPSQTTLEQGAQEQINAYQVVLQTPETTSIYTVKALTLSPFSALEQLRDLYQIPLEFNPPTEMGVFVTAIAGYENGQDGRYWVYEVNGERIPVAADRAQLQPNDELIWKFVIPSDE